MTAQKLANRVAMSALIEFNLEDASASQQLPPPPAEVKIHFDSDIDPDLLAGEDDLDLMQSEAENDFFIQANMGRSYREARRSYSNW